MKDLEAFNVDLGAGVDEASLFISSFISLMHASEHFF